jgi:hypothetical protein
MRWIFPNIMRRLGYALSATIFFPFLLLSLRIFLRTPHRRQDISPESTNAECVVDIDLLRATDLNLTFEAEYTRLEIVVTQSNEVDSFSGDLGVSLPDFELIDLDNPVHKCRSTSVTIRVPTLPVKADASHILFGVATTLERLDDSLGGFASWASGTNTTILAVIEPHGDLKKIEAKAFHLGIRLIIVQSNADFLHRYFALVQLLFEHRDAHTQWIGFIDDDTFFPSMIGLVSHLSFYDAEKPQYVGSLSEDFAQMYIWGFMAYGGAGIFMSVPLLRMLNENNVYENCAAMEDTGDRKIARCIYRHTNIKLSWEPNLHQLDLGGDMSGFYESGRPLPLSLHHWKSWYPVNMTALSVVASVCGDGCLLHRWRLAGDWFLVNGFSLIKYSAPLMEDDIKLLTMEKTWGGSNYMRAEEGFWHSLEPLRPRDGEKISFRLRSAIREESFVRQFYVRQQSRGRDQVVEVIWRTAS